MLVQLFHLHPILNLMMTVCISKDTNSSKNKKKCKKKKRGPTNWDQFRAENAGQGWNKKEMSYRYNQLYNN